MYSNYILVIRTVSSFIIELMICQLITITLSNVVSLFYDKEHPYEDNSKTLQYCGRIRINLFVSFPYH